MPSRRRRSRPLRWSQFLGHGRLWRGRLARKLIGATPAPRIGSSPACDSSNSVAPLPPRCTVALARSFMLAALLLVSPSCATRAARLAPAAHPVAGDRRSSGPAAADLVSYGVVLSRVVNGERIMPRTLVRSAGLVDAFLASLAEVGPNTTPGLFPTVQHRLAYAINAHNAAMLRTLIDLDAGGRLARRLPGNADRRITFRIDGASRTVGELRRRAIAVAGDDWRVHLALYAARMDGPPLPPRPFLPDLLDAQLSEAVRTALASDMVVRSYHGEVKRLILCPQLYDVRERLVADYEARVATSGATVLNALLDWCDSFRRVTLNTAVGYPVSRMPTDDRINKIDNPPPDEVVTAVPW